MNKKRSELRKKKRKEKGKEWQLNQDIAKLEENKNIDPYVAIKEEMPDYGDKLKSTFLFSFVYYNSKKCGLSDLNKVDSKKLVKKLRIINEIPKENLFQSKLIKDKIENAKDYKYLYDGLPPDAEVTEISFSNGGRIFAYFIDRFVCIVSIQANHTNTH